MPPAFNSESDDLTPIIWPLRSFAFGSFDPADKYELQLGHRYGRFVLQLDRRNAEFGLLHRFEDSDAFIAQYPDDQPVSFPAVWSIAVCFRLNGTCKKVCVQLPNSQVDLEFEESEYAQTFVVTLKSLASTSLMLYEVPSSVAFQKKDFNMAKLGFQGQPSLSGTIADPMADLAEKLWKTGDWSDFEIKAGAGADMRTFKVHKSILCSQWRFLENVCKPGFKESYTGIVELTEDAITIEVLLAELYGVEHSITGSVFTNFALKNTMDKEFIMDVLMRLYIAADKYNLEAVQSRVVHAIIDRLHLVHDSMVLLELASTIFEWCPHCDAPLRKVIVRHIQARLPIIFNEPEAKEELAKDPNVYMAVLESFSDLVKNKKVRVYTSSYTSHTVLLMPLNGPRKAASMSSRNSSR